VTGVALRILAFVIVIDLFYMSVGRFYLTQSEDHPQEALEISVDTDVGTLIGMGESLVAGKGGCLLCHKLSDQGNNRGPDLRGVGGRAASRNPALSAEAYLTESLVDPGAYVVTEFATAGGASIMPAADRPPADMSPTEMKALVAFLQSLGGEVTVEITAEDVAAAAAKSEKPPEPTSSHPGFALLTSQGCVACHDVTADIRRVGPPLTQVGERLSAAEIRQSIVDPNAVIADGYLKDLMLSNFAEQMSDEELDQLVAYLSGEVSLAARLAHPAVHLLTLIVIFNVGITWAVRRATAAQAGAASTGSSPWLKWGAIAVAIGLAGALYLGTRGGSPERPAATSTPAPVEPTDSPTQVPSPAQDEASASGGEAAAEIALDGEALFRVTCPACHGPEAKGVPGLGKDMTTSAFIQSKSDAEMVEFIKRGRPIDDPLNTTGMAMPAKGANMALDDAEILAIVEYIRSLSH
jgi:disulfide bond formation protein DsbB